LHNFDEISAENYGNYKDHADAKYYSFRVDSQFVFVFIKSFIFFSTFVLEVIRGESEIFNELSDEEKEHAARASSYRYFVASTSTLEESGSIQRDDHAKDFIARYVIVEKKLHKTKSPDEWAKSASMKLRKTLSYRAEKQVDAIRSCFDQDKLSEDGLHSTIRDGLTERFSTTASVIQGYTKEGSALFHNFPCADTSWDKEYYIKGNIYMLERALACTERKTGGGIDKVVVCYDYKGFTLKNSPPPLLVKDLLSDLRDHWPERLVRVFVVDAPLAFRA